MIRSSRTTRAHYPLSMGQSARYVGVFVTAVVVGCGEPSGPTPPTSIRQHVIGGRPSGPDEDTEVFVVAASSGHLLRCTGTLVAPKVVLTARHCVLLEKSATMACTSDGQLADPSDPRGQDLRTEEPENVTVRYGASEAEFVTAKASQIFVPSDVSVCRNDVAFIVLETELAPRHVPLRFDPIVPGERFRFSGWGYTADGQTELPDARSSLDALRVSEVGPGLIPAGTFAIAGNTTCRGDSGGGAWFGDALGGVYSRIEGVLDKNGAVPQCELPEARNIFSMLAPHRALTERAFAAAGLAPWYEGQPAPWLLQDGATCTSNDGCRSNLCREGKCASPTSSSLPVASSAHAPSSSEGCRLSGPTGLSRGMSTLVTMMALLVTARRRVRATSVSNPGRAASDKEIDAP